MRRSLLFLFAALLAAFPRGAAAAPPVRIGVLIWHESPNDELAYEGVRAGFELAGIQATFEVARAGEDAGAAEQILAGFRQRGFDLVYALGTEAARRAKANLTDLPVVFTAVTNPIGSGVVPSWDGSGSNLCGNSNWIAAEDILSVFREAVPGLVRLGVVLSTDNPVSIEEVAEAKRLFKERPEKKLVLIEEWIRRAEDLEEAVRRVLERGAQAVWVPIDNTVYRNIDRVAAITEPKKIPILSSQASGTRHRAVVCVSVDYRLLGERSVILAERVLRRGADPGELPVGRLRGYLVIANLAAARRCGLTLPLSLVATADELIAPEDEGGVR